MTEMQIYSYETATIRPRTKLYESVQRISICSQIERTERATSALNTSKAYQNVTLENIAKHLGNITGQAGLDNVMTKKKKKKKKNTHTSSKCLRRGPQSRDWLTPEIDNVWHTGQPVFLQVRSKVHRVQLAHLIKQMD